MTTSPIPDLLAAADARRFWFDTEFIEDGKTIELISIGIVADDGRTYYAEVEGVDRSRADPWLHENVFPHLTGDTKPRAQIAAEIIEFVGEKPEFWAYYADYDWVALCQLYGRMIELPEGWPMFCRDVKQLAVSLGNPDLPEQTTTEHHALADAHDTRAKWQFLAAIHTALLAERDAGVRAAEEMREAATKVADNYAAQMKTSAEGSRSRDKDPIVADCKMGAGYDIRDAIRALPIPAPPPGWRPIETAPKDGTVILLFEPSGMGGFQYAGAWSEAGRWIDNLFSDGLRSPTHWQPLPLPPAETSDNG